MSWQTPFLSYDDDALSLYANAGLLRRAKKDLEADKISLVTDQADSATLLSDGQTVSLNTQGLAAAQCTCSALSGCKHILAAVLWVQKQGNNKQSNGQDTNLANPNEHIQSEPDTSHQQAQVDALMAEVLALSASSIHKSCGIANIRLAYQYAQNFIESPPSLECTAQQIKWRLPDMDSPILYIKGTDFNGMVSELGNKEKKAIHLAAIAHFWQQHNQQWPWPEKSLPQIQSLTTLSDDEIKCLDLIEGFLHELLKQGLSHVSKMSAKQLQMFNMSARAEGLQKLSSLLRLLSSQVSLLAEQHFSMDEETVLATLSRLYAYMTSLRHATAEHLQTLRQNQKRQYQYQTDSLSLLPLGYRWWQSQTGALGASLYFWDGQSICQSTQARPNDADSSFNRYNIGQYLSWWQQSVPGLMHHRIELQQPRLFEDNLAFHGESKAILQQRFDLTEYQALSQQCGFSNWMRLAQDLTEKSDNDDVPAVLLLHICDHQDVYLDEIEQQLVWQVQDDEGDLLALKINWQANGQTRIDHLQALLNRRPKIFAVMVEVHYQDGQWLLQPFTVFCQAIKKNNNQYIELVSLDFEHDYNQIRRVKQGFISQIAQLLQAKNRIDAPVLTKSPLQHLCEGILQILCHQASTGRQQFGADTLNELMAWQQACHELGLSILANLLDSMCQQKTVHAPTLLATCHVCHRLNHMMSANLPIQSP